MPANRTQQKRKKESEERKKPPSPKVVNKIKFNISMDNLRPFVEGESSSRTTRKRSQYSEITIKETEKNTNQAQITKEHKNKQETSQLQVIQEKRQARSPDVPRDLSNQILKKIQEKGIHCDWKDIQEVKSQGAQQQDWSASSVWSDYQPYQPVTKNWSIASTNDHLSNYYNQYYQLQYYNERSRFYDPSYFHINTTQIGKDQRTTLMIKNIPNKYTVQLLAQEIDDELANSYDFLYLPCDIKNNCNVGYGFINMLDCDALRRFYDVFEERRWDMFKSDKICQLTYARLQGLSNLIEHFQNTKVLNQKDKKYQPIIRGLNRIDRLISQQKTDFKGENQA